ncbi:Asg7p SCDLUD_003959 [Saccharomycodes ludwigii]|uniref:Asg7p n=1 Tax=Saccharomycodes ludwigii TaxID=36035 RepID=UPI001E8B3A26|nr:hypothetical protein SCDLUD_003959 [Saccharomycodes ludwigii]KAH3899676.1 hypothetical protein SCDLUD_003959 [Saccharomycodes ludwigii]
MSSALFLEIPTTSLVDREQITATYRCECKACGKSIQVVPKLLRFYIYGFILPFFWIYVISIYLYNYHLIKIFIKIKIIEEHSIGVKFPKIKDFPTDYEFQESYQTRLKYTIPENIIHDLNYIENCNNNKSHKTISTKQKLSENKFKEEYDYSKQNVVRPGTIMVDNLHFTDNLSAETLKNENGLYLDVDGINATENEVFYKSTKDKNNCKTKEDSEALQTLDNNDLNLMKINYGLKIANEVMEYHDYLHNCHLKWVINCLVSLIGYIVLVIMIICLIVY